METLTHWKKLRNPDYLGVYAMPTDGSEIILTIREARKESVPNPQGKKSDCLVVYWMENVKPMILNATNAKMIQKVAKTPYIEKWVGVKVQIYVTTQDAFGEKNVDCLRIRSTPPQVAQNNDNEIAMAQVNLSSAESLEELQSIWSNIDKSIKTNQSVIAAKDKRKSELTTSTDGNS